MFILKKFLIYCYVDLVFLFQMAFSFFFVSRLSQFSAEILQCLSIVLLWAIVVVQTER